MQKTSRASFVEWDSKLTYSRWNIRLSEIFPGIATFPLRVCRPLEENFLQKCALSLSRSRSQAEQPIKCSSFCGIPLRFIINFNARIILEKKGVVEGHSGGIISEEETGGL